ncbi:MAG: hypothetical protein QOH17_3445 [Pseudonocardiales bacterium]|nr:hypothetical protein [Pseudonocardiales bacterium]
MPDPLAVTAARLRALMPGFPDTYAVETEVPDGAGWWRLEAVPVAQWCRDAQATGNPHRLASVAAMAVGGAVTHAVLARVTAALALDTVAWDVAADALVVHRAPWGHIDRVALRNPVAWVVGGDVGAGRVLPDEAALLDAVAATAVATLAPLLHEVRAATHFGLVPLWNGAADTVRLTADQVFRYAGRPPASGSVLAAAFLDALLARGAPIRSRGVEQQLAGRPDRMPVRAACCLAYRTDPPVPRPSDALCTTCPLLPAPERARRYIAFVDGLSASGPVR